jgi:hypothetical protein
MTKALILIIGLLMPYFVQAQTPTGYLYNGYCYDSLGDAFFDFQSLTQFPTDAGFVSDYQPISSAITTSDNLYGSAYIVNFNFRLATLTNGVSDYVTSNVTFPVCSYVGMTTRQYIASNINPNLPTFTNVFQIPLSSDLQTMFITGFSLPLICFLSAWAFGLLINWFEKREY